MIIRTRLAVLVPCLLLVGGLLVWLQTCGKGTGASASTPNGVVPSKPESAGPGSADRPKSRLEVLVDRLASSPLGSRPQDLELYNKMLGCMDTTIRFYGKVVDQHGQPVEGVEVVGEVPTYRFAAKSKGGWVGSNFIKASSSADGTFELKGAAGYSLSLVKISKPGYVLPVSVQQKQCTEEPYHYQYTKLGDYTPYRPDAAHPEVIRMWKLQAPEPFHVKQIQRSIAIGGPVEEVSVSGPVRDPSGLDFTIEARTEGEGEDKVLELVFRAKDGGFALPAADDEFLFTAPAEGYQETLVMRLDDPATRALVRKHHPVPLRLFARTRGGRFHTAVTGTISAYPDNVETYLHALTNPRGGRNLECDASDINNPLWILQMRE